MAPLCTVRTRGGTDKRRDAEIRGVEGRERDREAERKRERARGTRSKMGLELQISFSHVSLRSLRPIFLLRARTLALTLDTHMRARAVGRVNATIIAGSDRSLIRYAGARWLGCAVEFEVGSDFWKRADFRSWLECLFFNYAVLCEWYTLVKRVPGVSVQCKVFWMFKVTKKFGSKMESYTYST